MKLVFILLAPLLALQQPPTILQNPQAAQTAAAPSAKPSVVRGHIYTSDTGAGVKHADVSLRPNGRFQPQEAATDAQGGFEFRSVDPGEYTLSCSKTGFVRSSYGSRGLGQSGTTFTVKEGSEVTGIDCRMQRGGVITGSISDEDGDPLTYASVQVMSKTYRRGQVSLNTVSAGTTDDRGRYRIFDLSPGRYYVQAQRRGSQAVRQDSTFATMLYPNAMRLQDAQGVLVGPGTEVSGINITLRTVPTYSISGKVVDAEGGLGYAGGMINAMPEDLAMGGGGGFGNTMIKPDGTFLIKGLASGRYRLMVNAGGGGRGGFGGPGGPGGPGGQGGPRPYMKSVDLGGTNLLNLVIAVSAGATLKGHLDAANGTLPDNLRINLTPRSGENGFRGPGVGGNAQVGADGSFEVAGVQAGVYDLAFMNRGGRGAPAAGAQSTGFYLSSMTVGGQDSLDSGINVTDGATLVQLSATVDFRSATVTGHALNEDDTPMGGAPIVLVSSEPKKRLLDRYFMTTYADTNGNYKFSAVVPGSYLMLIWPESDPYQVQDPDLMAQLEKQATRVSVDPSGAATQDLKLTREIKVIAQTFAQ